MTPAPRQAVLVINTMSRKGQEAFEEAVEKLEAAGITLIEKHPLTDPDALEPTVRQAVASHAPMVIVGGGDGSLSSAVDQFVGSDTVFAFLPLGTANSFARTLGVPLDLNGAIEVIANGIVRRVDLGCINGDYYVNNAAIGLAPLIAETIPHKLKRYAGRVGYAAWVAVAIMRFKPFKLTVNGETLDATEVRIANGKFHGGTEVVEDAEVDSGEIVVQAVVGRTKLGLAKSWFASSFKLASRRESLREFHGRRMDIVTDPPLPISVDGEITVRTPCVAEVARGALLLAAPREIPRGEGRGGRR